MTAKNDPNTDADTPEAIGGRLREERKRFGLNQRSFAALGGLTVCAQLAYEKSTRFPDARYLQALATHGVDVLYVLTGRREVSAESSSMQVPAELDGAAQQVEAVYVLRGQLHRVCDLSKALRPTAEQVGAAVLRFT